MRSRGVDQRHFETLDVDRDLAVTSERQPHDAGAVRSGLEAHRQGGDHQPRIAWIHSPRAHTQRVLHRQQGLHPFKRPALPARGGDVLPAKPV